MIENKEKLNRIKRKYESNEKLIIARCARKTINYIVKNTDNFPNKYILLKNNIKYECYSMLKNTYRANIFQDINDKKEIMVNIEMLNYYLDESLREGILTKKKFLSYAKYLHEIDQMVRSWMLIETSRESI